jgi:hypothetical protein
MEAMTTPFSAFARAINDKCPGCKAPMVGTNPTLFPAPFWSVIQLFNSLAVVNVCIGTGRITINLKGPKLNVWSFQQRFLSTFA